jgi:hypothetical protein|eukprot:COSAG01_NODE_1246_length_11073_cov_38.365683_4_plen_407_part_00
MHVDTLAVATVLVLVQSTLAVVKYEDRTCYSRTTRRKQPVGHTSNQICFYGHCTGDCIHCSDPCVKGQGSCWQRASNDTEEYGVPADMEDRSWGIPFSCKASPHGGLVNCQDMGVTGERLPPAAPPSWVGEGGNEWIRYCRCEPGYIGPACEIEERPIVPIVYVLVGLVLTTAMALYVLGIDHVLDISERQMQLSHSAEEQRSWYWAAGTIVFQYWLMGAGVFAYSIAWTDDFFLIVFLRWISNFVLDFFHVIGEYVLPDDYTNVDAQMLKIVVAVMGPIWLMMTAFNGQTKLTTADIKKLRAQGDSRGRAGDKVYSNLGIILIYMVLPLMTIPVAGTLFKPIVGCHLDLPSLNPAEISAEDQAARTPPIDIGFLPVDARHGCSYGQQTNLYMYLGLTLMIPFWAT